MEKLSCEDCVHYKQHYIATERGFRALCCGHCMEKLANGRFRKVIAICESFQKCSIKKENKAKKEKLECVLSSIRERLENIEVYIENR